MDRKLISTLFVGDDDLECDCKKDGFNIDDLNISAIGFRLSDIENFDMIIYKGKHGEKILRSKYTKLGIIKN